MVETLDRSDHEPIFVLVCKETYLSLGDKPDQMLSIQGLRHPIRIIASRQKNGRFRNRVNQAMQTLKLLNLIRIYRPDIGYFSNANFLAAALCARLTRIPTVLRLMGVYPAERRVLNQKGIAAAIIRWAYRSPFSLVVCTQDGSGGEYWLQKAMGSETPTKLFLNGCSLPSELPEMDPKLRDLRKDATVVTHVGKLEHDKGAVEFIDGFLRAWKRTDGDLHALMIGVGTLAHEIRAMVEKAGAQDNVSFVDRLPHEQIPWVHHITDIFVSLNRLGNLSNANLEAMLAGCCMVFPHAQPVTGIDEATERLVPQEAALRISSSSDVDGLADALVFLYRHPEQRDRMKLRMAEAATSFIPSWKERVDQEIQLIESLGAS